MHGRGHVWGGIHGGGMCGRDMHGRRACVVGRYVWWGACMVGGMHGVRHARQGHAWLGVYMAGGMHGGGHVGMHGRGGHVGMAGEMATAADGMHPTGMHSCFI